MRGDGEEGVGEHGECDVAVPCVPGADLVVVEAGFVLARSEAFFDRPAGAGYLHDFAESGLVRVVASVEREFSVVEERRMRYCRSRSAAMTRAQS